MCMISHFIIMKIKISSFSLNHSVSILYCWYFVETTFVMKKICADCSFLPMYSVLFKAYFVQMCSLYMYTCFVHL